MVVITLYIFQSCHTKKWWKNGTPTHHSDYASCSRCCDISVLILWRLLILSPLHPCRMAVFDSEWFFQSRSQKHAKAHKSQLPPKSSVVFQKHLTYPAKFRVVLINPFLPLVERCLWNEQRLGGGEQGSIGSGPSGSTSGNHNGDARTATRWMSWRQMVCWRSVSIVRAHSWRFIQSRVGWGSIYLYTVYINCKWSPWLITLFELEWPFRIMLCHQASCMQFWVEYVYQISKRHTPDTMVRKRFSLLAWHFSTSYHCQPKCRDGRAGPSNPQRRPGFPELCQCLEVGPLATELAQRKDKINASRWGGRLEGMKQWRFQHKFAI